MTPPRLVVGQGTGVDLTPVPALAERLSSPGTVFARVFTDREWAYCLGLDSPSEEARPGRRERPAGGGAPIRGAAALGPRALESLAARWSAKEAAVKAWSSLISPARPPIGPEELDWAQIEVVHDPHRRPRLRFCGEASRALDELSARLHAELDWSLSLSHEGGFAIALVHLLALADPGAPSARPAPSSD